MVFLDYASTSPVVKHPQWLYRDVLGGGYFFNPNANYAYKEKKLLAEAENRVKEVIGAKSGKVIFGGTSSQLIENLMNAVGNISVQRMVLGSYVEHDSFNRYIGHKCTDLESLDEWLSYYNDVQAFVLWQAVQNITGEIFPTKQIGELVHQYNGFYICDGTAQLGHTPIEPNIDDWCDFWCCSGHKAGTELGIGCCWISDRLDKWLNGFKFHGTPNLAGALALTQAAEDACDNRKLGQNIIYYGELLDHVIDGLVEKDIDFQLIPEYEDNEPSNKFALAINAIRLPGIDANALQQYLASKQIYIGVGHSSCADNKDFRILQYGYGLSKKEASEVIRISFGENSNETDILALAQGVKEFKEKFV